jgi:hypothetical protein
MIRVPVDWCSMSRWGGLASLLSPLAGEETSPQPHLSRFVIRWACLHCERYFLGDAPGPQSCPHCGRPLRFVARWDLLYEQTPVWWRDARGEP